GGETDELMRIYITEGIARNGSPEFAKFMGELMTELRAQSSRVASEILKQDANLKQDAFVYEMTLNMIAPLDLPAERKAELLGKAFEVGMETDSTGQLSAMAVNVTNAFILMKSAGVTAEQAAASIKTGMATNQKDLAAFQEFLTRVGTYYPEVFT